MIAMMQQTTHSTTGYSTNANSLLRTVDIYQDMPLSELRLHLPGPPSLKTVQRWVRKGAKSRSGQWVKLSTRKLPCGNGSSLVRYHEFLDALDE